MDTLARAAAAAAEASVQEEQLQQELEVAMAGKAKDLVFNPNGFHDDALMGVLDGTLQQARGYCCAMPQGLCEMTSNPLSIHIRCDACGYCCHNSCRVKLAPPVDGLNHNRVCKNCVFDFGLAKVGRDGVTSQDDDLHRVLKLELHKKRLELIPKKQFLERKANFEDGVDDTVMIDSSDSDFKALDALGRSSW